MSSSIRYSNLFTAEDYKKVFKAYSFIDYTAYDFDTLKQALINYIQTYYPEDFNDYIESSEFIAIIELLAYYGTSLAFRTDLNSRENFIDTAERRESIIRLAQMVNYVPKRNIPASGLFKIESVQTDQPLTDANGTNLNDVAIFWNDPNNPDWFDQFVQICNAAFSTLNPFGRPTKSGSIGSIPTDLYQLNNILRLNVAYPVTISINGQQYPIDICNPDLVTNETIFERDPDPANPFNFIYRNDSLGVGSPNTGFFLYFKQGNLLNIDANFEFPVPNRLFPIDIENINQTDVYVQETDQNGDVVSKWNKVPALAGENVIYNSIQFAERDIFDVISGANNTVTIRFADGNFGNIPAGLFRFWFRTSANQALVIRPDNAQGLQINIPYVSSDNQQCILRITFSLEQTIGNAAPAETNEQIKLRAPEVFSTQSRMVNGSDYNVLPLIYGNQIAKLQALDRTYSGQSRYIDLNDPTGFHRDLIIFGDDGALFRDNQNILSQVIDDSSSGAAIETVLINSIQEMLRNPLVSNFFYDEYLNQFGRTIRVNSSIEFPEGFSLLEIGNPAQQHLYWRTSPLKFKNDTGYFTNSTAYTAPAVALTNSLTTNNVPNGVYQPWGFIKPGSVILFSQTLENLTDAKPAAVTGIVQSGIPLVVNTLNPYENVGPVGMSVELQNDIMAWKVYPAFRSDLTTEEIEEVITSINAGISFWLYYDLLADEWHTSTSATPGLADQSQQPFVYPPAIVNGSVSQIYSDWQPYASSGLLYVAIDGGNQLDTTVYNLTARGRTYVFESYRDVRFYWEPNTVVIDSATGKALRDTIEIMPFINTSRVVDNNNPIIPLYPARPFLPKQISFNISGVYTQTDGYTDSAKIEVSLVDGDSDGIADDPSGFNAIVSPTDRIVFEYYNNEVYGYQSTRPWISRWNQNLSGPPVTYTPDINLYVYFPLNQVDPAAPNVRTLYGSPYIGNINLWDITPVGTSFNEFISYPEYIKSQIPEFEYVYMDDADLIFINNIGQLQFNNIAQSPTISNQLTAFFNSTTTEYPWLADTTLIQNKADILKNYFLNKVYLLASISPPGYGQYYNLEFESTLDVVNYPTSLTVKSIKDKYHFDKNGKVFTQNTSVSEDQRLPLYFKWSHYSPVDQRVDPAATNIIDMIVITYSYYQNMMIWKNSNSTIASIPAPPTTEELRIQFQDLDQYKMVSDSMIWNSGQFKILFGPQAESELQATFKVVKAPSSSISDNEVKTKVIQAIDAYFDIRNWDFGEKFFYTELAAFIHQQLSRIISSVVIVPNNANSQFGNLFEIIAGPTEIFMSTATVNNVSIVSGLTDQNLRV